MLHPTVPHSRLAAVSTASVLDMGEPVRIHIYTLAELSTHGVISTVGVMVSTVQNPNNFDNFSSASGEPQFVNAFQSSPDAGVLCFPLDFSQSNITGVRDGANVTVQVVVAGSDGSLYQVIYTSSAVVVAFIDPITCDVVR